MSTADNKQFKNIAVLLGGRSQERDVSLATGKAVVEALVRQKFNVKAIDWQGKESITQLLAEKYDCVFIALHGIDGEDGCIQALLELLEIPYTGSAVLATSLCIDKLMTKKVLLANGLPVLGDIYLTDDLSDEYIIDKLGLPLCIKPVKQGSSVGIFKVESKEELKRARREAKNFASEIMAESWLSGPEYTVGILNNEALPSIWIEPAQKFYDYNAKYITKDTTYHCPSGLNENEELRLKELALRAFAVTGCYDWARVDFITDSKGDFYILEVNTVPGLTGTSLVPKAAKTIGISFDDLVVSITLNAALKQDRNLIVQKDKQAIA